jgi:hypothetical protein
VAAYVGAPKAEVYEGDLLNLLLFRYSRATGLFCEVRNALHVSFFVNNCLPMVNVLAVPCFVGACL